MYRWRWDTAERFSMTLRFLFSFYNDLMIPHGIPLVFLFLYGGLRKLLLYSVLVPNPLPSLAFMTFLYDSLLYESE
jgi:hypothetical protein